MSDTDYTISTMKRPDLDIAVAWAAREGWNPGYHDADCFFAADPEGFLIGRLGDRTVATISAVRYGGGYGFVGFYIVDPAYRGQGYGFAIWKAAMARLAGRTIGLDGVVDQQDNYRTSGFVLAHRNVRYEGSAAAPPSKAPDIVPLATLSPEAVVAYDRAFFPDNREAFLTAWLRQPESTALGCLDRGALTGIGMLRRCRNGHKIGPLFADTPEAAERLFLALQAHAESNAPIFLDVPETNPAAVDMARRHGMTIMFETARMYAGDTPALPLDRTFGITSFELG